MSTTRLGGPPRGLGGPADALALVREGIISSPGPGDAAQARAEAALDAAFEDRFPDAGLRHWGAKTNRGILDDAVESAGEAADSCVFVGEDPAERAMARTAGLRTAAHPVFARAAIEGGTVSWTRFGLPDGRSLAELDAAANTSEVVPVHVASDRLVLAMATGQGVSRLEQGQGPVEETVAFLLRDDRVVVAPAECAAGPAEDRAAAEAGMRASAAFALVADEIAPSGTTVVSLGPAPGGVYLAAAADAPVEGIHLPGALPGHIERLLPDPALLSRPGGAQAAGFAAGFAPALPSAQTVQAARAAVTPALMREYVARFSGAEPLAEGAPLTVRSRDAASGDNPLVVVALARRLRELGLTVRLGKFTWRGHQLANVEAEHRIEGSDGAVLITASANVLENLPHMRFKLVVGLPLEDQVVADVPHHACQRGVRIAVPCDPVEGLCPAARVDALAELGEHALVGPFREVAVDALVRREVMGEVTHWQPVRST